MDKQIKQALLILGVLMALSVVFAIVFFLQKNAAENRAATLASQVTDLEAKDREAQKKLKGLQDESSKLRKDIDTRDKERADLVKQSEQIKSDLARVSDELGIVKKDGGKWEEKIANIRKERDELIKQVTELKNKPVPEKVVEKIVYRDRPVATDGSSVDTSASGGATPGQAMNDVFAAAANSSMPTGISAENESYWAGVIRQKAALEIELQKVKEEASATGVQIEELKKSNSDYEMEIGRLKNEKESIIRRIKYGEDLADNISVELARARNEQKISQDRAQQLLDENQQLRTDIKQLTTTKVALEKSIANLSEEKNVVEKKLVETENIIQGRIDEIWQIKKEIDNRITTRTPGSGNGQIELAPIVVSAKKNVPVQASATAPAAPAVKAAPAKKIQGSIVSVNEENNFVIVDQGEKTGIKVGDAFKVYHKGVQVGAVEVIQVRQDISAADIKLKTSPFAVGDTVR